MKKNIEKISPVTKIGTSLSRCPHCHARNSTGEICNKCADELIKKIRKRGQKHEPDQED